MKNFFINRTKTSKLSLKKGNVIEVIHNPQIDVPLARFIRGKKYIFEILEIRIIPSPFNSKKIITLFDFLYEGNYFYNINLSEEFYFLKKLKE